MRTHFRESSPLPLCALARASLSDGGRHPSARNRSLIRSPLGAALLSVLLLFLLGLALGLPGTATAALRQRPVLSTLSACDPINADTTWSSGVYTAINCNIHIPAGVTLTIQAGAVIKVGGVSPGYGSGAGSAALIVDGGLVVEGDSGNPVAFTSLADDSRGGDSNGDGPGSGAAGNWYGIVFRPGSRGRLENFFVGYAGSGVFNATLGYGSAQITVNGAAVELRNGEVAHGLQTGVTFQGAGLSPVVAGLTVRDNRMTNGRGYAIYQATVNQNPAYSDLNLSGNDVDAVMVHVDAVTQDIHWGGADYRFVCGYTLCQLEVPNGKTLTVAPGTEMRFDPAHGIAIAEGGALIAQGTVTQPITFTSTSAPAKTGGEWLGLWTQRGSQLRLDHCDISYASDGNFGNGGLEIDTDDAQVSNCRIHHNRETGLFLYSRDESTIHPVLTNVHVTDSGRTGVQLQTGNATTLRVTWEGGSISRNGWSGVADYTWNSSIYPTFRNVTISDNGSLGDFPERRRGMDFRHHSVHPVLENVTFTGNTGEAIHWYCNGSISADGLTATGNGGNELLLPGCTLGGGRQWTLGNAGIPVRVTNWIEVAGNSLLTLSPGTTLRFDKNQYDSPTGLAVKDNAALYALGTAQKPIRFLGATATPGWWAGIDAAYDRASVVLQQCEIAYGGGGNSPAGLYIHGHSGVSPSPVQVQNCDIHHSARKGAHFDWVWTQPPLFRNNSIHDNGEEGVANWNAPALDARYNWWGDATGPYHAKTNPGGAGENVGDNVLFYPWLNSPPTSEAATGAMLIQTGGPSQISPGETVDYAIQYLNGMTGTVQGAVLALQLPEAAHFVEAGPGAIYWPDRHQVVWKLGDLPAGASGIVSARARFIWGLAADYTDGTYTLFGGANYAESGLDAAEYNAYQSSRSEVSLIQELTSQEFAAIRGTNGDLESLYQKALAEGYKYMSAARITDEAGGVAVHAALRTANRQRGRILSLQDGQALATTVSSSSVAVEEVGGGLVAHLDSQTIEAWGSWLPESGARAGDVTCTEQRCFWNCMLKAKSWGAVARKGASLVAWVFPPAGIAWGAYEVYDEIETYRQCKKDCAADPTSHCCTTGEVRWSPTILPGQCAKYGCDAVGTWKSTPDIISKCAPGERCVAAKGSAGGCKGCSPTPIAATFTPVSVRSGDAASACAFSGGSTCTDLTVRRAKDPNAIYGPGGDLLPGQKVSYTVTWENEGAGRAYGVYVVNVLPAVFDPASLNLYGKGIYLAESREIVWSVGELGPKGAVDSEGAITYTVALTGGLPSGTIVSNQAVVYFPSVPEETPTNTWVNTVAPLVALPQSLQTGYMTALPITLAGKEASNLPLTFEIVQQPHGGALSGTPPSLTYTPGENFTGGDSFSFRVSNGTSTSRAAAVDIAVSPAGDATPPALLWSEPVSNATGVLFSAGPLFTDTIGAAFGPVLRIGVSEPLSPTSVNTDTVTLSDGSRALLPVSVALQGGGQEIVVTPRQALVAGRSYTLAVAPGVTDAAGNPLTGPVEIPFATAADRQSILLPTILR